MEKRNIHSCSINNDHRIAITVATSNNVEIEVMTNGANIRRFSHKVTSEIKAKRSEVRQ